MIFRFWLGPNSVKTFKTIEWFLIGDEKVRFNDFIYLEARLSTYTSLFQHFRRPWNRHSPPQARAAWAQALAQPFPRPAIAA